MSEKSPREAVLDGVPSDWDDVVVEQRSENLVLVKRVGEDGSVPPLAIEGSSRPILVEVHFGRSAIVPTPLDAVRYGYQQGGFRTEFYFLDIVDEPKWVQISEDVDDPAVAIVDRIDEWVSSGELTEEQGEWARDQFE